MNLDNVPHVVYHVASMGNWKDVVNHQLRLLRQVGLHQDVRITYLGDELQWLEDRCRVHGVNAKVVRTDSNTDHYETFAMLEIEQLAKETYRPILYFHTKGVSNPGHAQKTAWRRLMEEWVIRRWEENVTHLQGKDPYDAVGVSWWESGEQHFSGNFWIARPEWIRRLPHFRNYHIQKNHTRFSCEMWLGAAQFCKAYSLGCKNEILSWHPCENLMPPEFPKKGKLPITVLIPTIPPREMMFKRALQSVLDQTYEVEWVMQVDLNHEGSSVTRNKALKKVTTEFVAFLDDDDELYPDHCAKLYDEMLRTKADVVYPGCIVLDANETPITLNEQWGRFGKPFDPELLREQSYVPVTSLVRTELARKSGFKRAEGTDYDDWGFYLGLLDAGAKFVHLPEVTWKWNHWGYGTQTRPGNTSGMPNRWS